MLLFITVMFVAVFAAGFLIGWWLGFTAPIDDRRQVDALARRDKKAVRSWM